MGGSSSSRRYNQKVGGYFVPAAVSAVIDFLGLWFARIAFIALTVFRLKQPESCQSPEIHEEDSGGHKKCAYSTNQGSK